MTSLGEQYPLEQARCRRIFGHFREIGPAGAFGAMMIEQTLQRADAAAISGDLVEIIAAFQDMKEIKE